MHSPHAEKVETGTGHGNASIPPGARLDCDMAKRLTRRTLALALLVVPVAARAQSSDPLDFLKSIYEPYKQAGFKGQPYWETGRFFAGDLAQAIERDFAEAKKRKEVPTLDGDPFIDAQDWDIRSVSYALPAVNAAGPAIAAISLDNSGKPTLVAVFLINTPQGWRIDDIVTRGSSLRALYKLK